MPAERKPGHEPSADPLLRPDDRSQLLSLAPGRLWVQDIGPRASDQPPLVLLHSLLVTGWDYRFVAEALAAQGRRVLVPDLFGCGNSDRPAPADAAGYGFRWHAELLAIALAKLGLAEAETGFDLLGHGYGASIAIHLAERLRRPTVPLSLRLRRLMLVAPHCFPVRAPIALPDPVPTLRRAWRWVGFAPLVFRTVFRKADLRRFLRRSLSTPELLSGEALADDVDIYWDRLCRDGGLEAVEAMLDQLDRLHLNERDGVRQRLHAAMAGLELPTMVLWGDRDTLVPTALAERCTALIPGAQLRIIEGCGHAPQRERPEALRRALASFERRMQD